MNHSCTLSYVTKNYLSRFYSILDEMVKGMESAELTDSISLNFIVQMIPHHKAAIEMSENILQYTTNIPLQNIAHNIITEQTQSIENMRKIECVCGECINSKQDICLYQRRVNQIMQIMFSRMENACTTNDINKNFIWEMVPHHRGAIEMSNNALQYDICQGLHPILHAIIRSQQKGIMQMQQLLQSMNC